MLAAWLAMALAAAAPTWRDVAPGVQHMRVRSEGVDAEMLRFDLTRFRPDVVVLGADGSKTAAVLRQETGAVAAVNGGFFDTEWRPLGLRIARGKTVIGLRPRVDWGVLVVRPGRAEIIHSREFRADPSIETAIQVGPRLLVDGQPLRLKPQSARRTAVAVDREGRQVTLIATHGSTDAQRLAQVLADLGFHAAMMLDGGPSTQLSAAVGQLRLDVSGGYAVPDALIVRAR